MTEEFDDYLSRWDLLPDGAPIFTATGRLLPVRADGVPAMLKITTAEPFGSRALRWWDGHGAPRVLARDDWAVLMERARDTVSVAGLARNGRDEEASRIVCAVVAKLHAPRPQPPPEFPLLQEWFAPLRFAADAHGGILRFAEKTAAGLLASPQEMTVLHGDIHHGNIRDFGPRGWLAIDPKGLLGERGFDYANLFCNPDTATATKPERLARQLDVIAAAASLERGRLLCWVAAWAGLSVAFDLEDRRDPGAALEVAELARRELGG